MEKQYFNINEEETVIPAILWGKSSSKMLLEIHGQFSNKEDALISLIAQTAVAKGYQVISFDLPNHGDRKDQTDEFTPACCIRDMRTVYQYISSLSCDVSVFACSIGAYFSLLAFHENDIKQSLLLSPILNMERIISNMMSYAGVSEDRLKKEKKIDLTSGQSLDWEYFLFVKNHPLSFAWNSPTDIAYGSSDELIAEEDISSFATRHQAEVTIFENEGHYLHTDDQLDKVGKWADKCLLATE